MRSLIARAVRERLYTLAEEMYRRGIQYDEAVREFRRAFLSAALRDGAGNRCLTARKLRLHRNTLSRQIDELQIDVKRGKPARKAVQRIIDERKQSAS